MDKELIDVLNRIADALEEGNHIAIHGEASSTTKWQNYLTKADVMSKRLGISQQEALVRVRNGEDAWLSERPELPKYNLEDFLNI